MGVYGLGKNSPVVLTLGKGNYEAMIERHGQNVRWMIARKCTCVLESRQPDPRCEKCAGTGEVYDFQKDYIDSVRTRIIHGMLELPPENINCEVLEIKDALGIKYNPVQMGSYIMPENPARKPKNGEVVEVVFRQPVVHEIEETIMEYMGNGFYRIPGAVADESVLEGMNYCAAADIIGIDAVFDRNRKELEIVEFRNNTVCLEDTGAEQPIFAFGVKYIKPFKFFVLSQDLDEDDEELLRIHKGDAISTFPYKYNVAEGDVITVLSGAVPQKTVLKRGDELVDVLPNYFVSGVDYLATSRREYTEGKDFKIIGSNKIYWICDDQPDEGESMSISYQYLPTYRVWKSIPQLRSSEDQRMPRKVVLKLFTAIQESRGVNKQRVGA